MQRLTHITFGLLLGSILTILLQSFEILLIVGISSIIPDIDWLLDKKIMRRSLLKVAWKRLFQRRGLHRTLLHNIWIVILLTAISGYIYNWSLIIMIGISIGILSHLILDSLTKMGIYWLWPYGDERIYGERRFYISWKIVTGSNIEKILNIIFILTLILVFVLNPSIYKL